MIRNRRLAETASPIRPLALLAAGVFVALFSVVPAPASALTCTKVISPGASVQTLVNSLSAGQTGCLHAGTYSGNVKFSTGGSAGAALTLTSYPGERATVAGKLWVADSANFVTVSSLNLDGRNSSVLPSPAINGDDVVLADNDITNYHTAICIVLGATTSGRANRTVVERNRVHNCGKLPPANLDHGIYVEHTTQATVKDNVFYDNADRGVQLYPDARGTLVANNIIDGNGEGVAIGGGDEDYGCQASNDNTVENNVITNSTQRYNVESWWGCGLVGTNNTVRDNCVYGGARNSDNHGFVSPNGFTASGNVFADPRYVDRAAKDFRMPSDSPCLALFQPVLPPPAADGDGFSDGLEAIIGTDPNDACPDANEFHAPPPAPFTGGDNAYPPDVDNSGAVNILDILSVVRRYKQLGRRYDLNGNGTVDLPDILAAVSHYGPCPG